MSVLTSEEARAIALQFLASARALTDLRNNNLETLTPDDERDIDAKFDELTKNGQDLLAASSLLAFEECGSSLTEVTTINNQVHAALKTLHNIRKGINIAAAAVTLGAAMLSKDPQAIGKAVKGVAEALN